MFFRQIGLRPKTSAAEVRLPLHSTLPLPQQLYPEEGCLETGDCPLDFYDSDRSIDAIIEDRHLDSDAGESDLQMILRGCGPQSSHLSSPQTSSIPSHFFHDGNTFTPTGLSILNRIWSSHVDQPSNTFTTSSVSKWVTKCTGRNLSVYSNEVLKLYSSLTSSSSSITFTSLMNFYASAAQRNLSDLHSDFETYLLPSDFPAPTAPSSLWDECEITDLNIFNDLVDDTTLDIPSHKTVELLSDNATPKIPQNYVFVDEGSCIGCTLCAQSSPSTFKPTSTGMFRAYTQKTSNIDEALKSCPVSCIHTVSYPELLTLEIARQNSNEKETPVWVRGIESSSANHDTTVYHSVKHSCFMSSACPSKGCYDCPHYDTKGGNPKYQEKERENEEIRRNEKRNIYAKKIRMTADL
ncbi:hypothetical protein TrLO_g390 [Triparma laevis f. longispina]|uniref:4Fe-4S ferredoxin-type domain-containing protein n=1 Tax=Triparma laevis f. longispina TaxID=1714387 RepID=A0A9W7FCM3_9STRA|nr:hypothetical protein TrLO_g390 [Triparma laevis f. longispina]